MEEINTASKIKQFVYIILLVVFLILGYLLGKSTSDNNTLTFREVRSGQNRLINPLVDYETYVKNNPETETLRHEVVDLVQGMQSKNPNTEISVWYRDLNNGPTVGVNEKVSYNPASLLKILIAMAYYKQAESDEALLSQEITYKGEYEDKRNFPIEGNENKTLLKDNTYTIKDLLQKMLSYSDNVSQYFLTYDVADKVSDSIKVNTIEKLGLSWEKSESEDLTSLLDYWVKDTDMDFLISAKEYSSILRILYNASYLDDEYSNEVLNLISKSDYTYGLVAKLPKDLTVAHKFGYSTFNSSGVYLYDCGIIYYPDHPYILCVMAKGDDRITLEGIISEISSFVYQKLDAIYKN